MVTGKNKERFEKWYLDKFNKCDKYDNWADYWLLRFYECPFEMQIGVYLAYYDSIGLFISIETNWSKDDKMDYCYSIESNRVGFGTYGFNSIHKSYSEAFKKADELINKQQN